MLMSDVCELGEKVAHCHITDCEEELPQDFFLYTFGFSCKDLSTLNNHSADFKSTCIKTGAGSTGRTWSGNLAFLKTKKPLLVLIENVPAARKGANYEQMRKDLEEHGYKLCSMLLNSLDCGFPQDRRRAWFAAALDEYTPPNWEEKMHAAVNFLKLPQPVPLQQFILPSGHKFIKDFLSHKAQLRENMATRANNTQSAMKKRTVQSKAKAQSKAKVMATTKKLRHGLKWHGDHWLVRRHYNMPSASAATEPPMVSQAAELNAMPDREKDLFRMYLEAPITRETAVPTIELKHSAPRVVRNKVGREFAFTSCLLPASKIMLYPPATDVPRFMCWCIRDVHVLMLAVVLVVCASHIII